MNFKEVRDLLKMMNVDMNEHHAHRLFTVRVFLGAEHINYDHCCNLSSQYILLISMAVVVALCI